MKDKLITIIGVVTLSLSHFSHAENIAGYCRLSAPLIVDTASYDDTGRYTAIPFQKEVAFTGVVASVSGNTINAASAFWMLDQWVGQDSEYYIEILSGASAGTRFDILSNTASSLLVDGTPGGVAAEDEFAIHCKLTLDHVFPGGAGLAASTASTQGTTLLFHQPGVGTIAKYRYRSDLGNWVNILDTSTNAGSTKIPNEGNIVLQQNVSQPINPIFSGIESGLAPFAATISYIDVPNDNFSNATPITGDGTLSMSTLGSGAEAQEPQHSGNPQTASVWFRYTAQQSGTLTVDSVGSDYDTVLVAYSGTTVDQLTELASNDDTNGVTSQIEIPTEAGAVVSIALDGKNGESGSGTLSWAFISGANPPVLGQPGSLTSSQIGLTSAVLSWSPVENATSYQIYRSSHPSFSTASVVASVTATSTRVTGLGEGAVAYFWLAANAGDQTNTSVQHLAVTTISPRPDLTIGKKKSQIKGNNVYNSTAAHQGVTLKMRNSRTVSSWSHVQNDGNINDSFTLKGKRGNRYFSVKYYRKLPGKSNITSKVVVGKYVRNFTPGSEERIQIKVKPTSRASGKRKKFNAKLQARSKLANRIDMVKTKVLKKN